MLSLFLCVKRGEVGMVIFKYARWQQALNKYI